jgi:signal transduction histidine kinase
MPSFPDLPVSQHDPAADATRTRELLTLLEVSRAIASTLELEPLLELILDQLKVVADYAGASVGTVDGDDLCLLASRGATRADRETPAIGLRLPLSRAGALWDQLSRKQPAIIDDVRGPGPLAASFRAWLGDELEGPPFRYIRASLLVPLVAHDRVIGLISLSRRDPGYYTDHHARLAEAIASQAALAIENARLYPRARAESRRTATLARIASSVAVAGPLDAVLTDLARRTVETSGARACAVFVTEGELTEARLLGVHGLLPDYAAEIEAAMQQGKLTFTLADLDPQRPIVRHNVWQTYMARPAIAHLLRYRERVHWDMTVLVPLATRDRKHGVLASYYHHADEPDADELAFLATIGNQAAIAVENARLFAAAQEKASLEERARLARELHDSATQTVFSKGMLANAAQRQHERGAAGLGETLARVSALAQQAHAELRALLFELRPEDVLAQGLGSGLERLAAAVQTRTGLPVTFAGTVAASLPPERALAVFRIIQEALNNAVKHARASSVTVAAALGGDGLRLTVADDGVGFDSAAVLASRSGLGMRSMQERAAAAGLTLTIASAPGCGTRLALLIPVPDAAAD